MLIIYHDSSIFKNNENCILDVDASFTEFGIPDTDYARKVLYEIEISLHEELVEGIMARWV